MPTEVRLASSLRKQGLRVELLVDYPLRTRNRIPVRRRNILSAVIIDEFKARLFVNVLQSLSYLVLDGCILRKPYENRPGIHVEQPKAAAHRIRRCLRTQCASLTVFKSIRRRCGVALVSNKLILNLKNSSFVIKSAKARVLFYGNGHSRGVDVLGEREILDEVQPRIRPRRHVGILLMSLTVMNVDSGQDARIFDLRDNCLQIAHAARILRPPGKVAGAASERKIGHIHRAQAALLRILNVSGSVLG